MGFYEQISKYYDYIFPTGKAQVEFIKASAGMPPKNMLDVACGSGGYSVELAKSGYEMTAVDLDDKMVEMAREKALQEGAGINVLRCNMKELEAVLTKAYSDLNQGSPRFDCIFCIGNSLVHLGSIKEITEVLRQMYSLLSESGSLLIQIINYDRIINFKINELPAIRNDEAGLEFIRMYRYDEMRGIVHFNTKLNVNGADGEERYENSIELLPVLSSDLHKALKEAGFSCIEFYGDFGFSPYNEEAFMLVVKATK